MPLLKHAKKKLRQDKKRTLVNKQVKVLYKSLVKKAKENPNPESISAATSAIDKATKNKLMHANKAARMKSALSKLTAESAAALKNEKKNAAPSKKAKASKVKATKAAAQKASTKSTKKK